MISKMIIPNVNVADDYDDLCKKVTQEILVLSDQKIAAQQKFTIALSGGSTPKGVYQCMASPAYKDKFQWEKIHFFWSDERWVPYDDPKSNYRMVSQALLTKVHIPSENIHPIPTNGDLVKDAARLYEGTLSNFFKLKQNDFPVFDLVLLGLGQDGHTASLFPGNPALLVKDRLAEAVSQSGMPEKRVTLTFPVINHADMVLFLVSGPDKAEIVHEVLENKNRDFPANEIKPSHGKIRWFLDKAAASKLVNEYA